MDQNNSNIDITHKFINNVFDNLSYIDLYGNSVIIFIILTLFVYFVYVYCQVMQTKTKIADDWLNQRCKPQNILFAGYITHPEGTTPFQYTNENFQYCVQGILKNITEYAFQPFQFMMSALTQIFSAISNSIQLIREIVNRIRNSFKEFSTDVLSRILNILIPIQKVFIALMDTFSKIQGIMTSGLYTMLGTYYTLQALMGAILEMIVKILIILAAIIVALWILPFTWPMAASMTVMFLAIAIPMAIIVIFMTNVLHIKTSGLPGVPSCFDRKTKIYLIDGTFKFIEELKVGDELYNKSIVTSKIKVKTTKEDMFKLGNIIVSGSHRVLYKNKWILIREHCKAIKITEYNEPFLFCINTTNKLIQIEREIFTDWDDIYSESLEYVLTKSKLLHSGLIHLLDKGYTKSEKIKMEKGEKNISEIRIGEKLSTQGIVYGIVEMKDKILGKTTLYNLLVSNKKFETIDGLQDDYNFNVDGIL
jgi:hypothetical protein